MYTKVSLFPHFSKVQACAGQVRQHGELGQVLSSIVDSSSLSRPLSPSSQPLSCLGLRPPESKCVFLPPLSQQRLSPREYEESAPIGQGRWRTSANSKVLVAAHACGHGPSELLLGACCSAGAHCPPSFLPQVRLTAASRRCPRASSSLKTSGRRYRSGPTNLGLQRAEPGGGAGCLGRGC